MRVLVTGGTGFIGSHLLRRLLASGAEIHTLAREGSDLARIESIASQIHLWRGDITNFESVKQCTDAIRPDLVYHLAGNTSGRRWSPALIEADQSIQVNLCGTVNVIRALQASPNPPTRLVRAGGLAEYGEAPVPFDEQAREQPVSAYGASQAAATMLLSAMRKQLSFPTLTLRFAAVYGPGRETDFFLPALITRFLEGRDFEMTSGNQPWDLVYVDDAVDALWRAAHAPIEPGEIINVGSGVACTLREVAELVARKIGGTGRLRVGALPIAPGDVRHLYCRIEKAKQKLGWEPRVDLETGLDRTIAWYREQAQKAV